MTADRAYSILGTKLQTPSIKEAVKRSLDLPAFCLTEESYFVCLVASFVILPYLNCDRLFRNSRAQANHQWLSYTTTMRTYVSNHHSFGLFATLIPDVTVTEVKHTSTGLVLTAFVPTASAACPHCDTASTRVHSYYTRQPHDLPISGLSVRLLLHLRRFRCLNSACQAITFSERVPALITPAAQRTVRLNAALRDLVLAFGAEAAARQSKRSAMTSSADTLLRRAHAATHPAQPTPRILGIDDFAFQKGQVYGTILTDGETHKVVELLPDRSAQTATAWLREHPGIEVITRDRASDYARAAREGAPKAVQVADRFHLVKNAGEVLERVVGRHYQGLRAAAKAVDRERIASLTPFRDVAIALTVEAQAEQLPLVATARQPSSAQQRRLARYQDVLALAAQGLGPTAIGQQVSLTRQTVADWLQAKTFPERLPSAPRRISITPYEPYLRERWEAGCQNGRQLWREVQANGFTGGHETVRRLLVTWRTERGRSGPSRRQPVPSPLAHHQPSPVTRPLSPWQV